MEPTFFGDESKPLYGVYHPPLSQVTTDTAVLICYPLLQEYIRSHRALCYLAEQLAKAGCHVFRFDYSATGDSAGHLSEADLQEWQKNIHQAEEELRDLSGLRKVSVIGLRFGAMLAMQHDSNNIRDLILWDPVINGKQYIEELSLMHERMLSDSDRFLEPRSHITNNIETELLGFSLPNKVINQILALSDYKINNSKIENIYLIETEDKSKLFEDNKDILVKRLFLEADSGWNDLEKLEDMLMPYDVMNKITELLV